MCHQSVGLIQGAIEQAGISTISITVRPEVTLNMQVPRAAYVRFPTGNPVGEPHKRHQQRAILRGVLQALEAIEQPGTVIEMPYRWRRMPDVDVLEHPSAAPAEARNFTDSDLHAAAAAQTSAIGAAFDTLVERIATYRAWVEAQVSAEQARAYPDSAKLQALGPQLTYVNELSAAIDGPAHDALVRVSDRVVRIRHWQDGVFL
ncbi:MAG: hypothetical protein NVSMB2_24490 [Chloroflexota bacterium]